MGLLDDAIREHLELKRKHGADPDDLARQEREALGPGQRNEFAQPEPEPEPPAPEVAEVEPEPEVEAAAPAPEPEPEPAPEPEPPAAEEREPWLEEPPAAEPPQAENENEDVLDQTPDFLQETPEHDRLWFEQKPPRDFDWDK